MWEQNTSGLNEFVTPQFSRLSAFSATHIYISFQKVALNDAFPRTNIRQAAAGA